MPKMTGFHQKTSTSRLHGLCNYICKALTEIQLVKYKHQESYTFGSLQVFISWITELQAPKNNMKEMTKERPKKKKRTYRKKRRQWRTPLLS